MLEIHPQLLLYQGIIFLVFVFLMWKFVYKSLVKMVEDRRHRIENTINEAEQKNTEANQLKSRYENKITEIDNQADTIRQKAELEGLQKRDAIIETARTEASQIIERGKLQTITEREAAMTSAKDELLNISVEVAKKALKEITTPDIEEKLIEKVSEEIKKTEWKK
jgi:F-type H+-transporting ATPase subunit b